MLSNTKLENTAHSYIKMFIILESVFIWYKVLVKTNFQNVFWKKKKYFWELEMYINYSELEARRQKINILFHLNKISEKEKTFFFIIIIIIINRVNI
jgi:hypothetical protein